MPSDDPARLPHTVVNSHALHVSLADHLSAYLTNSHLPEAARLAPLLLLLAVANAADGLQVAVAEDTIIEG